MYPISSQALPPLRNNVLPRDRHLKATLGNHSGGFSILGRISKERRPKIPRIPSVTASRGNCNVFRTNITPGPDKRKGEPLNEHRNTPGAKRPISHSHTTHTYTLSTFRAYQHLRENNDEAQVPPPSPIVTPTLLLVVKIV